MQVMTSLHKLLLTHCPTIHRARLAALMINVGALVQGQKLTVTALGRAAERTSTPKHAIKQSDRLIGNVHLTQERGLLYQAVAKCLLTATPRPVILVDWSDYTYDRTYVLLRAAVPVGGRALTLYEEVHPRRAYGNTAVHRAFLDTLQTYMPRNLIPTLVTDAGFIGPWFADVRSRGWQFVGRIRKNLMYRDPATTEWQRCETLYAKATRQPRYHGPIELARKRPFACHLYLVRQPPQGRHERTAAGQRSARQVGTPHALRETSPWLLVTSLDPALHTPQYLMRLYKTRMQIEQAFRDIKNTRAGFALRESRSRSPQRLANLLLVGMLAGFALWLVGRLAIHHRVHYQLQANTVRKQHVLSAFFIACQLSQHHRLPSHHTWFEDALALLHLDIARQSSP